MSSLQMHLIAWMEVDGINNVLDICEDELATSGTHYEVDPAALHLGGDQGGDMM